MGMTGVTNPVQGLDLQGHRGARGLMPENTLPGFAAALAIGVTTLEMDLALTRDLQVVVIHNLRLEPEITRSSDGTWLQRGSDSIHSMTLAQVKTYDVGRINPASHYAQRFPEQQAVDGTSVPTLAEVFELVEKSGNLELGFNVEVKIDPQKPELTFTPKVFVQAVVDVIRAHRMEQRVTIQSFDWRVLQQVQQLNPEITTAYLTSNRAWLNSLQVGSPGASPWLNGFDVDDFEGSAPRAIKAAGGDIWSSHHKEVDVESIKLAHDLGLSVSVWTVNDASRMRQLIKMGVDGIISDYPNRLRLVLEQLGLSVPRPSPVKPG